MARTRNEQHYQDAKTHLLQVGVELLIQNSFHSVGINQILQQADVPKGSFYHYFKSKDDFGVQVLDFYHQQQLQYSREQLQASALPPYQRLKQFFEQILNHQLALDCSQGCLMIGLSQEVAARSETFRMPLQASWGRMTDVVQACLAQMDKAQIGLAHLSDREAADFLLNSWGGALMRMKAEKSTQPLQLFCKTFFKD